MFAALSGCDAPARSVWRWAGNGPSRSGLLRLPDGVLLGNEAGTVARLGKDGEVRWLAQVGREVAARPAVVGDVVVVATVGGEWVGLSADGGQERWRLGGKPPLTLPLAADATRAFAVAGDGSVLALSGANGGTLWKRLPPRGPKRDAPLLSAPAALDGRLFVALGGAGLFALNPEDGDTLWHHRAEVLGFVAEGARVYVAARDGTLWALSSADGAVQWKAKLEAALLSGPSLARGLLWLGAEPSELVAVDPQDGSVAWRLRLPAPLRGGVESYRELVLVPTNGRQGRLLGLRVGQTAPVVDLRLDSHLRTAPQVFGDVVVVQATDGRVLAFQIKRTTR